MTSLEAKLNAINGSANSLKTLYFRPPGIFTNAITGNHDITALLRDADAHENALYHIDHQDKPERCDGTRGVVDRLNEDMEQVELGQLNDGGVERPSVVLVPKEVPDEPLVDHNRGVKNLLSTFNEENEKDYDVDVLCETVSQLLDKYPIDGVKGELEGYRQRWETLNLEIMQHEETMEKQRRQLSLLNMSLNDRQNDSAQGEKVSKTVRQLVEEEEEEIRKLELEMAQRGR